MRIRITKYTSSKIEAIKCLRNSMTYYPSLQMAKEFAETLPLEADIRTDSLEYIGTCFEFEACDSDNEHLFAAWEAISKERKSVLLQYLVNNGMLNTIR